MRMRALVSVAALAVATAAIFTCGTAAANAQTTHPAATSQPAVGVYHETTVHGVAMHQDIAATYHHTITGRVRSVHATGFTVHVTGARNTMTFTRGAEVPVIGPHRHKTTLKAGQTVRVTYTSGMTPMWCTMTGCAPTTRIATAIRIVAHTSD